MAGIKELLTIREELARLGIDRPILDISSAYAHAGHVIAHTTCGLRFVHDHPSDPAGSQALANRVASRGRIDTAHWTELDEAYSGIAACAA